MCNTQYAIHRADTVKCPVYVYVYVYVYVSVGVGVIYTK